VSVWNPAESKLAWSGFADGSKIGSPTGPAVNDRPNPYAAMAAEMVGDIALNVGTEYMAPEGKWNEDLGKMVYTKKKYSSIFGKYDIPEDAIWNSDLPEWQKKQEIQQRRAEKANEVELEKVNSMFEPSMAEAEAAKLEAYNQSKIIRPLTEEDAIKQQGYEPQYTNKETRSNDLESTRFALNELIAKVNAGDDSAETLATIRRLQTKLRDLMPSDFNRLADWRKDSKAEAEENLKTVLTREGVLQKVPKHYIEVPPGSGMWVPGSLN
jgi:hypothetical protein